MITAGCALLLWPLVWPSRYLAAPIWLGFIFLLDPINVSLDEPSLIADAGNADYRRAINLVLSGFLCGVLWEFWNYWAGAKWHYSVPIMSGSLRGYTALVRGVHAPLPRLAIASGPSH